MDQLMNIPAIATVIGIILGFKAFVFGCMKLLESFKDKTASNVDNKIFAVLAKLYDILGAIK